MCRHESELAMDIFIDGVRSFKSGNTFEIRPITLVVGENSSGKSALMACVSTVLDQSFPSVSGFNTAPFTLGGFNTICTDDGRESFTLALSTPEIPHRRRVEVEFVNRENEPVPSRINWESSSFLLDAKWTADGNAKGTLKIKESKGRPFEVRARIPHSIYDEFNSSRTLNELFFSAWQKIEKRSVKNIRYKRAAAEIRRCVSFSHRQNQKTIAIAPLRSKPERIYDRKKEGFDPTGAHIPFFLSRTLRDDSNGQKLYKALDSFGKDSGLFDSIEVKRYGKGVGDPFQISVKLKGGNRNLTDVGYGVSQALPIAVESISAPRGSRLLIQQPEVHLHPKAQASIASVFTSLYKTDRKNFVIETHSDYVVDRFRQHVRNGDLKPSDISLIFLTTIKSESVGYQVDLDSNGHVVNPPERYREFFIHEQMKML